MFWTTICLPALMFAVIVTVFADNRDTDFEDIDANSADVKQLLTKAFGNSTDSREIKLSESLKHKTKPLYRLRVGIYNYRKCKANEDLRWVKIIGDRCRTQQGCSVDATKNGTTFDLIKAHCVA
ncbi:uncharacterized protein LOC128955458 [Oppia nitens]|uniref:uncharacterized protein LOC128955458 n=1 Tax=Oppia nitens TaxID=1686743 RepID=UPI0023DB1836|nr:uncharacterized protein LOC128955458 [Oppia nitens]